MSRKPENSFISRVHRGLGTQPPHFEKTNNPFRSGMADVWYSGSEGDLWVEYKYLPKIPTRAEIIPDLTAQQKKWLYYRHAEGRNVAVILGCPQGGVIYRGIEWTESLPPDEFVKRVVPVRYICEWILSQTGNAPCLSLDTLLEALK